MPKYRLKGKLGMCFAARSYHVLEEDSRMARRNSKKRRVVETSAWVKSPEQNAKLSLNDNTRIATSSLRFREQKSMDKLSDDLSWQIRFAQMKLHHWHDVDNGNWGSLDKLRKIAEGKLNNLGPV